jgi:transcriptional repressor NrdR
MVMESLAQLDQVAYVRFASVYREFTDVEDFVAELAPFRTLQATPPKVDPE